MKKALVVFLILAVAGGLFAQTALTFGASVNTGLAVGFTDAEEGGDAKIDFVNNRGENGIRGTVTAKIRNGDDWAGGTFGANAALRIRADNMFNGTGIVAKPDTELYAFWFPISILRFQVGTHGNWDYGTPAGVDESWGIRGNKGLSAVLRPISGLDIMASALYGASDKLVKDMNYGLAVSYGSDLFSAIANLRYYSDVKDAAAGKIDAGAGFNFKGLSGLGLSTLAADVGAYKIDGDKAFIGVGEKVEFKALANALTLVVKAGQYFAMGSELDSDFIPMYFHGEVSYKINSTVTAGVEGRYKIGAAPSDNWRNAWEIGGVADAANFVSGNNKAGFGISPVLTFNVGPTIKLGYNLRMDLSEGASSAGTSWKTKNLIYAGVDVSF
jgi:hypothetical protein